MMTLELSGFSVAIEGIKFSSLLSKISRISKKTLRSYESFVKMHFVILMQHQHGDENMVF